MEITEVRVKLVGNRSERLRAFCSVTLDGDFVVRDLKVIDGTNGPFVAMPSRKLADRCRRCGCKNHLRARYCNECGNQLGESRAAKDSHGRAKLHADVAHPINSQCRERIQATVVEAFSQELEKAKEPGYKQADYDDDYDDIDDTNETAPRHAGKQDDAPPPVDDADAPLGNVADDDEDDGIDDGIDDSIDDSIDDGSEYDSLIADLKREAADRRGSHSTTVSSLPDDEEEKDEDLESQPEPHEPAVAASKAEPEPAVQQEPKEDPTSDFGAGIF